MDDFDGSIVSGFEPSRKTSSKPASSPAAASLLGDGSSSGGGGGLFEHDSPLKGTEDDGFHVDTADYVVRERLCLLALI